jgi:hypothetical protein
MHARWFKVRTGCRECGFHVTTQGDARDVVRALDGARDGVAQCATCRAPIHEVEAWEDRWDGWYVSGFRGTRPGATWEEDGHWDEVRADAASYVYVWRLQNEIMDAEPFHFEEYGDGTEIEVSYATEEEARAALEDVRDGLEDDGELVLEHVRPTCLEVRP